METLAQYINTTELMVILSLVVFNWVLSIAVSLYKKQFRLRKMADFMLTRVLPYVIVWSGTSALLNSIKEFQGYEQYLFGVIVLALLAHIIAALKSLGLKVPDTLSEK